jgi:hypothetical protein
MLITSYKAPKRPYEEHVARYLKSIMQQIQTISGLDKAALKASKEP